MQPRQHEITRDAHRHMEQSLNTLRRMLTMRDHKRRDDDEVAVIMGDLEFLEHVLEFSATWNGVPTMQFFPGGHDNAELVKYFTENNMTRLGGFFARQFVDVAKELRALGSAYPSILRKLYESYYVVTIPKGKSLKVDIEI
jgi:hypothetical protein